MGKLRNGLDRIYHIPGYDLADGLQIEVGAGDRTGFAMRLVNLYGRCQGLGPHACRDWIHCGSRPKPPPVVEKRS